MNTQLDPTRMKCLRNRLTQKKKKIIKIAKKKKKKWMRKAIPAGFK